MPTIVATQFPTPVSIVAAPVAKGLLISTNIAAGYHEQDSIMLHRQPDLAYPLHHKANGLPYAAFVDDKLVRERGLRMVSHFDLLPYSDEKAMQMLSMQWKYHDPAGTYWTTVEKCYTLMAVGHVPRSVPDLLDDDDGMPDLEPPSDSDDDEVFGTVVSGVDRTAPAIYDDLHDCVGWPPSDSSSSTVSDPSTCKTWRSNVHERNEHSYLPEARVLASKPSLKTVDWLFFTGEKNTLTKACRSLSSIHKRRRSVLKPVLALSMVPSSTSL